MFFHSSGFEVNEINNNGMVQGENYTVDEASLLSLTPIISLYELPVLAAFP